MKRMQVGGVYTGRELEPNPSRREALPEIGLVGDETLESERLQTGVEVFEPVPEV